MEFKSVFLLQGSRAALLRLIVACAAVIVAAGFARAQSPDATAPKETLLYRFRGQPDGACPSAGLTLSQFGTDLVGTTINGGGPDQNGTVFKLEGTTETVVYRFSLKGGGDGSGPSALTASEDFGSVFYGTTVAGGDSPFSLGTVFQLTPADTGEWIKTIPLALMEATAVPRWALWSKVSAFSTAQRFWEDLRRTWVRFSS